jgi:hypothetical protein
LATVFFPPAAPAAWWPQEAAPTTRKRAGVPKAKKGVGPGRTQNQTAKFWFSGLLPSYNFQLPRIMRAFVLF